MSQRRRRIFNATPKPRSQFPNNTVNNPEPEAAATKPVPKLNGTAVKTEQAQIFAPLSPQQVIQAESSLMSKFRTGWQMFLNNPCHTATGQAESRIPLGRLHWTFPALGPIDSSPAAYKGIVYVGSDDGNVYAIEERTGRMLWHSELGIK